MAETKTFTIDAAGKKPGRVATEVAHILLGKSSPDVAKNTVSDVSVTVENTAQLDITDTRAKEVFKFYSGYPSGQRLETWGHYSKRRGHAEMFTRIVSGMLPKNKLHKLRMKNLTVTE